MARAFGGHGERVTKPEDIVPAIRRGIQKTKEGIPVLLDSSPARRPRCRGRDLIGPGDSSGPDASDEIT